MNRIILASRLLGLALAIGAAIPGQVGMSQEQSAAQVAAKQFRDRFTKLRDNTKKQMRDQAVKLVELERKTRTAAEQATLQRMYEDRRDFVFAYYEAKIKALKELKSNHPSTTKSVDKAIASTNKNFSRDLGYIDDRQTKSEKSFNNKPKKSPAKKTKPKAPTKKQTTKRKADSARQAKIQKLNKQIRDLQFKINSMNLRKGEATVEFRRAKSNYESATSPSDKRRKKTLMDQANKRVWKHRADIKLEEIKLRRYQAQLKTIGG